MKHRTNPSSSLALLALFAALACGCSNAGDTNPITPDKMNEMRHQEAQERGGFKPSGTPPPPAPKK